MARMETRNVDRVSARGFAGLARCGVLAGLLAVAGCGARPDVHARPAAADLVLLHGDVHTLTLGAPRVSAVAIAGGTIVRIGDDHAVEGDIGPATRVIDLHGRSVTPGLVDAHCHLAELGADLEAVSVRGRASAEDVARVVAAAATTRPATEWLQGRGWDQNRWPGQQFPTRATLDAVVHDRPVLLERVDGHAVWVNGAALAAAGVTARTPDPAGGKILRDGHGEPTGVFIDNAIDLITRAVPKASAAARERRILAAAQAVAALGLTGIHEMGVPDETVAVYRDLARRGRLPLRVYAFLTGDPATAEALRTRAPDRADGRLFTLRGVKFFADGALGSRGARLREDYLDDAGNRGLWVTEPAALTRAVDAAIAGGWQVAVHAIGDAGVGAVLDAYAAAERAHPAATPGARRLRVEHVQVISAADVTRMADLHVVASMQPTHATSDMPWAEARLGAARIRGAYAWRTMLDHHIPLAFGSDFPVEAPSPLLGLYAAVTRQDADGQPAGGWYPAERLTLDEALAAFTTGAAFAAGEDPAARRPRALGARADRTVYDRALTADRGLLDTRVDLTIVDGQIRFDRATPPAR
jgi:predicted amidohydrolase YtcJ